LTWAKAKRKKQKKRVERKKKKEDKGNNKPNKGLIIINATAIFILIYQSNKFRNHEMKKISDIKGKQ
jgi:hypothetical protein